MKKSLITVALITLIFSLTSILTSAQTSKYFSNNNLAQTNIQEVKNEIKLIKDETVYISLNYDGSKNNSSIVNHINTTDEGIYVDYGNYSDIKSLSNEIEPKIEGNKIIWQLPFIESGFYYQGTLENSEVPFEFKINYKLDGKDIKADELIGKSGKVEIDIKVISNQKSNKYFLDNYLCQLQIPISLDKNSNILSEGAQSVTVGKTKTLAFLVLPGQNKEFNISFDTINFEMDSISATILPFDSMDYISIDTEEIKTGISDMEKGTDELINGTKQLKEGINEFSNGIQKTAGGANELTNGTTMLKEGVTNYTLAVSEINSNMSKLSEGLNQLNENGNKINLGFNQLSGGITGLLDSLMPLMDNLPQEQKTEYLNQINHLKLELSNYSEGINNYTNGVTEISQGLTGITFGLDALSQENQKLVAGAAGVNNGLLQLNKGLNEFEKGFLVLPLEIQKLIDGQKQLQDGMKEAANIFDDFDFVNSDNNIKPISFADNNQNVNSVQFIVRTPELKKPVEVISPKSEEKNDSFLDRVRELFK